MKYAAPQAQEGTTKPTQLSFFNRQTGLNAVVETKLTVGSANDAHEHEANRMADMVMRKPDNSRTEVRDTIITPVIQRACAHCEQEKEQTAQRKETGAAISGFTAPPSVSKAISRSGSGLDSNAKTFMESRFNRSFDNVQVHTDSESAASARDISARAYTSGNHIVFGDGQYQPNTEEGRHLLAHELTHTIQQETNSTIQRKKIPTEYGKFETNPFAKIARGVNITLFFHPDKNKVDAKKIALSQSVKSTLASGVAYAFDPNKANKMVANGKLGAGYAIDRLSDKNNPIYGGRELTSTENLKDTPQSNNLTLGSTLGPTKTNQLGQCYKVNSTDADKTDTPAGLYDEPKGGGKKGESMMFETTALAIEGTDKNKYYGSVKWGYKMEGTDAAPTVTETDIELASNGTPTANFMEPAKLWNKGKTRGTLKVTADPATVWKTDMSTETLVKDKKLKQLETAAIGTEPVIKAEVLNSDGTGSGKIVYIKNADAMDAGDGAATKQLPTVDVKVTKTQIMEATNSPLPATSSQLEPEPTMSKMQRTLPAHTRVEIIFPGRSSSSGEKLPQVKVLEGTLIGTVFTISKEDMSNLENEGV
jgi:hypothetical protein